MTANNSPNSDGVVASRETTSASSSPVIGIARDHDRLGRVGRQITKRVIFWTTPYKQLYKDPAIWVRVNDRVVAPIEQLQKSEDISGALRLRVEAGIRDAETKNEALWKLYVFLSDGLFYTGSLARLMKRHPCGTDSAKHEEHLHIAQDIVVRAIRCAWRYWQESGKSRDLTAAMPLADLVALLGLFVNETAWYALNKNRISREVSAVSVSEYLHGDNSRKCRDVRYKFDARRLLEEVLEQNVPAGETREIVRHVVQAILIGKDPMNGEELAEVVSRLATTPSELGELFAVTARNQPVEETKLRDLWLSELR